MISPLNCIYSGLTAAPCCSCHNYLPDTDDCKLKYIAIRTTDHTENSNALQAPSYEEKMKRYWDDRRKLLELSKESLVDIILPKPAL